jgi:hypothetical protein
MNTLTAVKEGDLYYTQFLKKYYFFQIIRITKDVKPPYKDHKYGYFIVGFEKPYDELPQSIEELDLVNIYKIKYKPKNTILYISLQNEAPEIKMKTDIDNYKNYSKYNIEYFGNTTVSEKFNPEIVNEDGFYTENNDGIIISPTPVYDVSYVFYIFENDSKNMEDEMKKVAIKKENIIKKYAASADKIKNELKKCVAGINKLNEKYNFIMTIEAEELYEELVKISKEKGLLEEVAEKIIEDNRDW